jgi:hypothetical protein
MSRATHPDTLDMCAVMFFTLMRMPVLALASSLRPALR